MTSCKVFQIEFTSNTDLNTQGKSLRTINLEEYLGKIWKYIFVFTYNLTPFDLWHPH